MFQDLAGLMQRQTFEIWERPDPRQTVWISAQTAWEWAVFEERQAQQRAAMLDDPETMSIVTQEFVDFEETTPSVASLHGHMRAADELLRANDEQLRVMREQIRANEKKLSVMESHDSSRKSIRKLLIIMLYVLIFALSGELLYTHTERVHREQALSDFFRKPLRFEWNVSLAVLEFADVVRILEQPYAMRVPSCRLTCGWRSPGPSFIPIREEEALGLTLRLSAQHTAVFQIPAVYGFKPTASVCRQHICDLIRPVFQAMVNSPCDLLVTSMPSLFSGC